MLQRRAATRTLSFRGGGLQRTSNLNPAHDPLRFPVLFPHGEPGWGLNISMVDPISRLTNAAPQPPAAPNPEPAPQPPVAEEDDEDDAEEMRIADVDEAPADEQPGRRSRNVTMRQFAGFRLFQRTLGSNHVMRAGRLLQEYMVDLYAKVEHGCLSFLQFNQDKLRAELYSGLTDAMTRA